MSNWAKIVQTRDGNLSVTKLGPIAGELGTKLKHAADGTVTNQVTIIGFVDLDKATEMKKAIVQETAPTQSGPTELVGLNGRPGDGTLHV